jgi:hypothetical protein
VTKRAENADAYCWVTVEPSDAKRRTQVRVKCLLIDSSGLAIAEPNPGRYSVTHLASGLCIGGDELTETKAREVMAKLLPLANWTGEKSYRVSLRKLAAIGGIVKKGALVGWK